MPSLHRPVVKALSLVIAVIGRLAPFGGAAEFAGGTGEPADPYQIATAPQLISIGNDADLLDKYYRLIDEIDLDPNLPGGQVFTTAVIASSTDPYSLRRRKFTGRLYADGHAIRNLTIDNEDGQYLGLLGAIGSGGRVYDLNLQAVYIRSGARAGALAGHSEGSIVNCSATGRVAGGAYSTWLGGLIGINAGGMVDCHTDIAVTCGENGSLVGGLAGLHQGRILNCGAAGSVSGGDGAFHLGGLVGMSLGGAIEESHATGFVSGGEKSWGLGGLVGREDSESLMIRCQATGDVVAGRAGHDLGGLVGQNWYGHVSFCRATGSVAGGGSSYALGGLFGSCVGSRITACYATGTVAGNDGSRVMGGLAGQVQTASVITDCYAIGRILVGANLHGRGGLIGRIAGPQDIRVTRCFWDLETSGAADSAAGQGLDTAQMHDRGTYQAAGWDLAGDRADGTGDVWNVSAEGGYPTLAAFSDPNERHVLEGAGKSFDPYIIATAEDLGAMVHYDRFSWYQLSADIDLAGITWTTAPIPAFDGVFDGHGHRIVNLTIRSEGTEPAGLFGRVESDAWVFDLGLDDVAIDGADGASDLGGIAGINVGTIINCYVTGTIAAGANARSVGGLVGSNRRGSVGDCYATATVTGRPGSSQLGGLIGYNFIGPVATCYAAGSVRGAAGSVWVGALVGHNAERAPVVGCYYLTDGSPDLEGTPLTDPQMKEQDSFVDWDFAQTWTICADQTYPHLQWEQFPCDPQ